MQRLYVLGLVYSIILAFIYGLGQLSPEFMLVFSNVLFPATAGTAVMASFWTLKKYAAHNPKPKFSASWIGFSSGLFMWFLGESAWAVYVLLLGINPFPSLADVFYIGGYVFLGLALFLILKLFPSVFSGKKLAFLVVVSVSVSTAVGYFLLTPILTSEADLFTTVLSAAYPILDIGLFVLVFSIFMIFIEGTIGKAWFFLTLGVALNIIADLLFNYAELQGFYYEGHPLELFWLWGYIAFFLGFYIHKREF